MTDTLTKAYIKIEDDIYLLEAAAGVLHVCFKVEDEEGRGACALAQSLWFTARNIQAAVERIKAALGEDEPKEPQQPCATHLELRQ